MPTHFRTLSRLSFMAQQMMLPREPYPDERDTKVVESLKWAWADHYSDHQRIVKYDANPKHLTSITSSTTDTHRRGSEGRVQIGSRKAAKDPKTFPKSLDKYSTTSDGVWRPDCWPELGWSGGDFPLDSKRAYLFDPFHPPADEMARVRFYTARPADPSVQWAYYTVQSPDPTRGSIAIAAPADGPKWLLGGQYKAFCGLRAYPQIQAGQLCKVLNERSLPFAEPDVRLLVQQLLYPLGRVELTAEGEPYTVWKADLDPAQTHGNALAAIGEELQALVDELAERPRDHEQLLLVVDVANYIYHWTAATDVAEAVRHKCVAVAVKWAQEVGNKIDDAYARNVGLESIDGWKAEQAMFRMYAILAHGGSYALQPTDLRALVEINALAFSGRVYSKDAAESGKFEQLRVRCQNVMAGRIEEVLGAVEGDRGMLTGPVRMVIKQSRTTVRRPATSWSLLSPRRLPLRTCSV